MFHEDSQVKSVTIQFQDGSEAVFVGIDEFTVGKVYNMQEEVRMRLEVIATDMHFKP
jgi:uncharacterized membrane protein